MSTNFNSKIERKFHPSHYEAELKDRIRLVVEHFGGPKEFSKVSEINTSTLFGYLSGKSEPKFSALESFKKLGVSIDWLISGKREPSKDAPKAASPQDYTLLPRYDVTASAGSGSFIDAENIKDKLSFSTKWLEHLGLNIKNAALLNATGDSMEPTIKDGSVLLIKLDEDEIKDGSIYVIQISGQTFVKRLKRDLKGIQVISDNLDYKEQFFTYAELEANPMTIAGRVIWYGVYA